MNKLYKVETVLKINDNRTFFNDVEFHYGTPTHTENTKWTSTEFIELLKRKYPSSYRVCVHFKEPWLYDLIGVRFMKLKDITYATELQTVTILSKNKYTIVDLARRLPANEFLMFVKDHLK